MVWLVGRSTVVVQYLCIHIYGRRANVRTSRCVCSVCPCVILVDCVLCVGWVGGAWGGWGGVGARRTHTHTHRLEQDPLTTFVVVVIVVPSTVMSGGFGNAMGRVVTQLVDRFVTEKLANNHTFQQAAVKTARKVADMKKATAEGNIKMKPEIGNNSLFSSIRKVKNGLAKEINEEIAKANAKLAKK